jgi:GGDEF domain-containing protein
VSTSPARREAFLREAAPRLPGLLVWLNLADLKRRNAHLGHAVGDADIAAVERLLSALSPARGCWARVGGNTWCWVLPAGSEAAVRTLLDGVARAEAGVHGFEVTATRAETQVRSEQTTPATFLRAVRCLGAQVGAEAALTDALRELEAADFDVPVGRLVWLEEVGTLARVPFRSVVAPGLPAPACALCGGDVAWRDGDGSVFDGSGVCVRCEARVTARDTSRREPAPSWAAPPRPVTQESSWVVPGAPPPLAVLSSTRVEVLEWHGERVLATRFSESIPAGHEALLARPGWDVPLVAVEPGLEAERRVLLELLPRGVPSIWGAPSVVPPSFVLEVAERFLFAHRRGERVGELHPALVFIDEHGGLAGCAQRPLRVERALLAAETQTACPRAPLFAAPLLTPAEVRSATADSAAEDVFRLAGLLWWWRHREPPFGFEPPRWLERTAVGKPLRGAGDELDGLLAQALSAEWSERPSLDALIEAVRSAGSDWSRHGASAT